MWPTHSALAHATEAVLLGPKLSSDTLQTTLPMPQVQTDKPVNEMILLMLNQKKQGTPRRPRLKKRVTPEQGGVGSVS
jgi:hypothetical protein